MNRKTIRLWEEQAPNFVKGGFKPYIDTFLLESEERHGMVLVFPGGAYGGRADHEGSVIAKKFNSFGFHSAVVHYRVAPERHPAPILDAARAVSIARENTDDWKIRPGKLAVCGFSAGGHLAASLAVYHGTVMEFIDDKSLVRNCRPDAAILCYPVINFSEFTHKGSVENLLGKSPSEEMIRTMSLELNVHPGVPPTFLWHSANDNAVPVENSLLLCQALSKEKIPFELHVFPNAPHGTGLAENYPDISRWPQLAAEWLIGMGW